MESNYERKIVFDIKYDLPISMFLLLQSSLIQKTHFHRTFGMWTAVTVQIIGYCRYFYKIQVNLIASRKSNVLHSSNGHVFKLSQFGATTFHIFFLIWKEDYLWHKISPSHQYVSIITKQPHTKDTFPQNIRYVNSSDSSNHWLLKVDVFKTHELHWI